MPGATAAEPLGVSGVRCVERGLPVGADLGCGAVVDRRGGVQSDPGMAVLVVVVAEEHLAETAGIGQGPEPVGEARAYFRWRPWWRWSPTG